MLCLAVRTVRAEGYLQNT